MMKKLKIYFPTIILLFSLSLGFNSCDYLESEEYLHEVDNLNDIWKSRKDIRSAWAACFGNLPVFSEMASQWPFSGIGDEGLVGLDTYSALIIARGKQSADNIRLEHNYWAGAYRAIRICNLFLENSDQADDRLLAEGEILSYQADVRFLRAYYYSLLLEIYGPFIIVDKTIDYSTTDLPTKRATVDESVEYIISELDRVITELPEQADIINSDLGRPSKAVAMATKARVLLWAASPLANGNSDYASFENEEGIPLFNQTEDKTKWQKAAEAYKDIIDLNQYELVTVPANDDYITVPLGDFEGNNVPWPDGPAGIDPYRSYKELFNEGQEYWNSEAIWQINNGNQNLALTGLGFPRGHIAGNPWQNYRVNAIQKLVDAYQMNNGKTIEEENYKLYNDLGMAVTADNFYILGDQANNNSPIKTDYLNGGLVQAVPNRCLNREPRFYATIGFQGRGYQQDDKVKPYYFIDLRAQTADGYIQTDRPSCLTGYPVVKWVHDEDNRAAGNFSKQYPIYRLAEVYLSYAEALNEYEPENEDILKYLNLVRYRAGLPGYTDGTQEEIREYIKRERFVEFAFEGKRYFDMKRWKDADKTERDSWGNTLGVGGSIYGCNYNVTDADFYDRVVVDGYIFKKKDYFFPIPYSDVANHWGSLIQNPGW